MELGIRMTVIHALEKAEGGLNVNFIYGSLYTKCTDLTY